jgi:hypothetical protein
MKAFGFLIRSTIWVEHAAHVKLAWITLLAEANQRGEVTTPVPVLAHLAGISIPEMDNALEVFLSPEKRSRSQEHGGRRLAPLEPGAPFSGFLILNYVKYRDLLNAEITREYNRLAQQKHRAKVRAQQASGELPPDPEPQPRPRRVRSPNRKPRKKRQPPLAEPEPEPKPRIVPPPIPPTPRDEELKAPKIGPEHFAYPAPTNFAERCQAYLMNELIARLELQPADSWPEVKQVIQVWGEVFRPVALVPWLKDPRFRVIIERGAEGKSPDQMCKAIRGAKLDSFISGNTQFSVLTTVLRDAGQVDKFCELFDAGGDKRDRRYRRNDPVQPSHGTTGWEAAEGESK